MPQKNAKPAAGAFNRNKQGGFEWRQVLALALLTSLVYANTLRNEFVYDDNHFIVNNQAIRNPGNILHYFTSKGAFSEKGNFFIYRPLATLSFALDYRLWKLNPAGYHATSTLFHVLNALLRRLTATAGQFTGTRERMKRH